METIYQIDINGTAYDVEDSSARQDVETLKNRIDNINVEDQIAQYIDDHNIEGVTDAEVQQMVDNYMDTSAVDSIEGWLDNHPEATTTVQDGAITTQKLAADVIEAIDAGGQTPPVQWISQGLMRDAKFTFQGWAHCIRYDETIGKAIGIVMGAASAHGTSLPLYRVTIDDDGYMSDYEAITFYDTDGTTEYTLSEGYLTCLCRLSDGSYITQCQTDITGLFKSTDQCKTFKRFAISGLASACQLFGMVQLSNGRLIAKCNGRSASASTFAYSDNLGVTWTETAPLDLTVLGRPPFESDTSYQFGEPCIIEFSDGKLLAVGRASNNAKSSNGTVRGHMEGAVISYSNDHGATWSTPAWSESITDMTGCNASCVYSNDVYHLVVSSRYTYTADPTGERRYSAMYYHWAKEEDALNDNWSEAIVIDYGHWTSAATTPTDTGYPSAWTDKANNIHAVWYDGDGSGTANGANWRLATGNIANNYSLKNEGSGSYVVGYTQKQVEALLLAQKKTLMASINDLYEKIGELPPDSGDYDGSMYITSDLLYYFIPADSDTWEDNNTTRSDVATCYYSKAKYAKNGSAYLRVNNTNGSLYYSLRDGTWAVETKELKVTTTKSASNSYTAQTLVNLGITSTDGFTIEGRGYVYSGAHSSLTSPIGTSRYGRANYVPYVESGALKTIGVGTDFDSTGYFSVAYVITPESCKYYLNGSYVGEQAYSEGDYDVIVAGMVGQHNTNNYMRLSTLRYYNRALSADEVYNNYLYDTALINEHLD